VPCAKIGQLQELKKNLVVGRAARRFFPQKHKGHKEIFFSHKEHKEAQRISTGRKNALICGNCK
jgi:hypothetical protein